MAGVPCVNDTCSVVTSTDVNGRLELDVNTSTTGGLECVEGSGLSVKILGDPTPQSSVPNCNNLLGITTTGDLFASFPDIEIGSHTADRIAFPGDTSNNLPHQTFTVSNGTQCDAVMIITVVWSFIYQVSYTDLPAGAPANLTAARNEAFQTAMDNVYHSDGVFYFKNVGAGSNIISTAFDINGTVTPAGGTSQIGENASIVLPLNAGATENFEVGGFRETQGGGTAQKNVNGSGGSNGLKTTARVAVLQASSVNISGITP